MLTNMTARRLAIFSLFATVLIVCWPQVRTVLGLGLHDDRYVQIIAAPFLFSLLMYWERNRIFPMAVWSVSIGLPLLSMALAMYFVFLRRQTYGDGDPYLMLTVFAMILGWIAMFILCFGVRSFRTALFPCLCLLLMIPVPVLVMDKLTAGLQHASAATSYEILRLIGVPVFAQGMTLSLPGPRDRGGARMQRCSVMFGSRASRTAREPRVSKTRMESISTGCCDVPNRDP